MEPRHELTCSTSVRLLTSAVWCSWIRVS